MTTDQNAPASEDRKLEISKVAESLKAFSLSLNIPIMTIPEQRKNELNREAKP